MLPACCLTPAPARHHASPHTLRILFTDIQNTTHYPTHDPSNGFQFFLKWIYSALAWVSCSLMPSNPTRSNSLRGENSFASLFSLCIAILTFSIRQNVAHGCSANLLLFTARAEIMCPDDICGPMFHLKVKVTKPGHRTRLVLCDHRSASASAAAFLAPNIRKEIKSTMVFTAGFRERNLGFK